MDKSYLRTLLFKWVWWVFFAQFLGSDTHLTCWLGLGILNFSHWLSMWRRRVPPGKEAGRGRVSESSGCSPQEHGVGVSDQPGTPRGELMGLCFPSAGISVRVQGMRFWAQSWLLVQLKAHSFSFSSNRPCCLLREGSMHSPQWSPPCS